MRYLVFVNLILLGLLLYASVIINKTKNDIQSLSDIAYSRGWNNGWDDSKEYYTEVIKMEIMVKLIECLGVEDKIVLREYLLQSEKINSLGLIYQEKCE